MKAKDWEFEKLIPDAEDCEAACKSCSTWMNLPRDNRIDAENVVDTFHGAFMRGLAWAKAKYNIKD